MSSNSEKRIEDLEEALHSAKSLLQHMQVLLNPRFQSGLDFVDKEVFVAIAKQSSEMNEKGGREAIVERLLRRISFLLNEPYYPLLLTKKEIVEWNEKITCKECKAGEMLEGEMNQMKSCMNPPICFKCNKCGMTEMIRSNKIEDRKNKNL